MPLDNILPDSFGLDIVDKLKETSPNTKIVIITSVTDKVILEDALKTKVDDYIIKPYKNETLIKTIRQLINK